MGNYNQNLGLVMEGSGARMVSVDLKQKGEAGDGLIVSVAGKPVAEITPQEASYYIKENIPGRGSAIVMCRDSNWSVRVSSKIVHTELLTYSY